MKWKKKFLHINNYTTIILKILDRHTHVRKGVFANWRWWLCALPHMLCTRLSLFTLIQGLMESLACFHLWFFYVFSFLP